MKCIVHSLPITITSLLCLHRYNIIDSACILILYYDFISTFSNNKED